MVAATRSFITLDLGAASTGTVGRGRRVHRAARDVAEIFLDQRPRRRRVDVARKHEHRIVRAVIVGEPVADVLQAGLVEVGHRSDRRVPVRMAFGEEVLEDLVEDEPARLVVALALLVLDDAALVIELALSDRAEQVAHAVGFHEQGPLERARRNRLEVIGAVEVGRAVVIGRADLLQIFEDSRRGDSPTR